MRQTSRGFTIIELMVTIFVLAIVVGIALPSFNAQIQNNRSVALTEDLVSTLNIARIEAVRRGGRVSVCASDNGTSCGTDWTQGWIVFIDTAASDTAASPVIANTDAVIRRWEAPPTGTSIAVAKGSATGFIRYTGMGTLGGPNPANPVTINAQAAGCQGQSARVITIRIAGLLGVEKEACS